MDHLSNLSSVTSQGRSRSAIGAAAAVALDKGAGLQFPGEDGGHSLAAWARRDLEATLQLLADRAQYITGGSGAAIALRDGEHIICRASSGPSAPEVGSYLQVSSGLSGESVRTRKILACDNAATDPRVNRESCQALGIASFVVMPLVRENDVVGIFEIFSSRPHAFQERDLQALERLGEMVNTALDQITSPRPKPAPAPAATPSSPVMQKTDAQSKSAEPPRVPNVVTDTMLTTLLPKAPEGIAETKGGEPESPSDANAVTSKPAPAIGTCASCGFPVSPGRAFCLDCEAALPEKFGDQAVAQKNGPTFLTDLADGGPQPEGFKHWIIAHRYRLGTILVLGGTAALLFLR
jgi:hypothetical protein